MNPGENEEHGDALPVDSAPPSEEIHCRDVVTVAIHAFLSLAKSSATDDMVSMNVLQRIGNAVINAEGALAACYQSQSAKCDAHFAALHHEKEQKSFFTRVIIEPFIYLLDDPDSGIEHRNLSQYYAAVRMIVGDEKYAAYEEFCAAVAKELEANGQSAPWDEFYKDPQIQDVLEEVLVAIAQSFRRFEQRKDWFLIMMNTDPESVSLSTNSFVPKKSGDKLTQQFNDVHFTHLFKALFAPVQLNQFDKDREAAFTLKYGKSSKSIFGPIFTELATMSQSHGTPLLRPRAKDSEMRKKLAPAKKAAPSTSRTAIVWGSVLAVIALGVGGFLVLRPDSPAGPSSAQLVEQMELVAKGGALSTHVFGGAIKGSTDGGGTTVTAEKVPSNVCVSAGWRLARKGTITVNGTTLTHVTGVALAKICSEGGEDALVSWTVHQ